MKRILPFITLLGTLAGASAQSFTVSLDGLQEVPANASPATGSGTLTLAGNSLSYNITFSGLVGSFTASHIHGPAAPGVNAGVLQGLILTSPGVLSGSGVVVSASTVNAMLSGQSYVNIHSSAFTGGEIRGQVALVPEPSSMAVLGLGLGALALVRKRK